MTALTLGVACLCGIGLVSVGLVLSACALAARADGWREVAR